MRNGVELTDHRGLVCRPFSDRGLFPTGGEFRYSFDIIEKDV